MALPLREFAVSEEVEPQDTLRRRKLLQLLGQLLLRLRGIRRVVVEVGS